MDARLAKRDVRRAGHSGRHGLTARGGLAAQAGERYRRAFHERGVRPWTEGAERVARGIRHGTGGAG